ncbi:sensor histidine kinase [Clostridium saccharobutylicum]|uniref:histidine kinase n=1 Tax=Clostridium saccharobutylicum TaxID=169679 RepID=A0A1S8MNU8_CLOSA|nr:sensor histidine kinase [Clostridium saccharobutylicum]OOM05854.1 alkaline phosphatase synthesis sensor protein PhoR [Clostridium saccharobutylicum]
MKSIKSKLVLYLGILIVIICIGLSVVSYINSSNALLSNLSKTLPSIAEQTASSVQGRIEGKLNTLESIAERSEIKDINNSWKNKMSILSDEGKRIGSIRLEIVDKNGDIKKADGTTSNVKERAYFKNAISGKNNVSDPLVNNTDKSVVVIYAVPIKDNDNQIIGVLIDTQDGNDLSELTNRVKVGKTGYAFMIKKDGTNIASTDENKVINMYNPVEEVRKDPSLRSIADIEIKMGNGETGIGEYLSGADKYVGYAPIEGTEWSVGVIVLKSEMLSELDTLKSWTVLVSVLFLLIGFVIIYIISSNIVKGIKSASKHLDLLANGNLCKEVSVKYLKQKDEIGAMTSSMKAMQQSLENMIKKIEEDSAKKIKETLKIQDEIFANVSHELKTPLNVIFSANQLTEFYVKNSFIEDDKEKILKNINIIKQNCYRFMKLINNIVDISKMNSGFFKVNLSNENIVDVTEEIVQSISEYINAKHINIIFDTNTEEKIIACDPEKIERVILNLISNAIKFTNTDGSIFVNVIDKGDTVEIDVKDTGIGIEEKYLNNIFERFEQVDKSISRNAEGSGIGLSLVKSIVNMHGGKISVESEVGKGSIFKIELPAKVVEEIEVVEQTKACNNKIEMINVEFSDIYSI